MPPVRLANHSGGLVGDGDEGRVGPVRVLLGGQPQRSNGSFLRVGGDRVVGASTAPVTMIVRRDRGAGNSTWRGRGWLEDLASE